MNREIKYFQNYLYSVKNLSNKTIESYTYDLLLFNNYLNSINKKYYNALNEDITNYLSQEGFKNKTFNRKITSIKEFYKYLNYYNKEYNININKITHIKNEKVYPRIISFDDIKKMYISLKNTKNEIRNQTIILLLYISGLRVSELINLTFNDVNIDEGYIRCIGKGDKEKIIIVGDLLSTVLNPYIENIRNNIDNNKHSNYIFINEKCEKLSRQYVYNIVNETAKNAQIKLNVTPHTLRHCFATHMLENGADVRSVQEMLGHSNITTTQIYLNISNKALKENYLKTFKDPLKED